MIAVTGPRTVVITVYNREILNVSERSTIFFRDRHHGHIVVSLGLIMRTIEDVFNETHMENEAF